MIESIHIKNFRGIQDGKIDRFSKINLLVGPNNSGKSAVLEAIYFSNTATAFVDFKDVNKKEYVAQTSSWDLLGHDPIDRICNKHLKQPTSKSEMLKSWRRWRNSGFMLDLEDRALEEKCKVGLCVINAERQHKGTLAGTMRVENVLPFTEDFDLSVNAQFDSLSITLFWENTLTYYQAHESSWIIKGLKPAAHKTLFYDVSTSLSHLPFEYFRQMLGKVPGWTHKIANSFERIIQLKHPFNVTFLQLQHDISQTQGFIAPEDKVALTIDDYGDGARSAFKMLTPLTALTELATEDAPGVFIWEEPELFQNPRTLGKLLEEIALLIKDKPVQLFIATHSLDVIAQFTALAESGQIDSNDLMTFRLNLQEGQLTSSWFNVDNLKAWLAEGLDPRVWGEFHSPLQFRFQEDGE